MLYEVITMNLKDFLKVVENQAQEGVDFMTIHSGVTRASVLSLNTQGRIVGITSRGGAILAEWMKRNNSENPLFEYYDEILDILAAYNVVISLGDGLRPGATHDANDRGQIHEMIVLGELTQSRITSYNVCYTKLLRSTSGSLRCSAGVT